MKNNVILGINFEYTLLEYYKKLSLDEKEVMVIFAIKHLLDQKNRLITSDLLSIIMNYPSKEIDQILVDLLSKKFIQYKKTSLGLVTTLRPLKEKLNVMYSLDLSEEINEIKDSKYQEKSKRICAAFENAFERSLSPVELSLIDDWLINGISEDVILTSLRESVKKKKLTLRAVDKLIITYQGREDIDNEGYTTLSSGWKKNINKTIDIANKKINDK